MIMTNNIGGGGGGGDKGLLTQGEVHPRSLEHQMTHHHATPASAKSTGLASQPQPKKRRNLPGTPDPSAEVIALSPKTLMATNRFVCEICNKGFQRDQNLQLHRRGHNLPWKLRQRTDAEIRKRVYVCPEKGCVHHNPGRALGDLTGIKKHFCRKHGEKKWKCDKCARRYAVHSDWKAHVKTCGSREYKCDCGTIFSRRDSFITHRAFCDALAEENNKLIRTAPTLHHNTTPNPLMMAPNTTTIPLSDYTTSLLPMSIGDIMSRSTPATSINFDDNMGWNGPVGASAGSSATALLQRATLMGATASGGDVNGGYGGLMHGNILDGVNCFGGDGGGVGVFASWVGTSDGKSGSSRWCVGDRECGGDVMTVDFLGRRQQ